MVKVLRTLESIESDLANLRRAAERAGTALGCSYGSSDEFVADEIMRNRARMGFWTRWTLPRIPNSNHIGTTLALIGVFLLA